MFISLYNIVTIIVRDCFFISIINAFVFFNQWRVHSKNRYKLIVVIHRDQKSFNVTMINYQNSSIYVQRQINRLLRRFRQFFKIYVDDIIFFSKQRRNMLFICVQCSICYKTTIFSSSLTKHFWNIFSFSYLIRKSILSNFLSAKKNVRCRVEITDCIVATRES